MTEVLARPVRWPTGALSDMGSTAGLPHAADTARPPLTEGSAIIEILGPGHALSLRAARLEALRDSPEAFVADAAVAERRPPIYWTNSLKRSRWVMARVGEETVGIACLARRCKRARREFVESVWVTEGLRRKGLVRRMLEALEVEARADGAEVLKLWILETNMTAADAYIKLGFSSVPDSWQDSPKRRPDGTFVQEFQMVKQLLT